MFNKLADRGSPAQQHPVKQKKPFFFGAIRLFFLLIALLLAFFYYFKTNSLIPKRPSFSTPKSAYELYRYAKAFNNKGQFFQSEKLLKKALELKPDFYKALIELGWAYSEQGDFIKALPLFEMALAYAQNDTPNYEIALYDAGKMFLFEGKPEEAWNYFTRAYQIKSALGEKEWPKDSSDAVYYVMTKDKEGFVRQAKRAYPEQLRKRAFRIYWLTIFRPQAAIEDCERYLTDNPGSRFTADFLVNKAMALGRIKEYGKAIEILESVKDAPLKKYQKLQVAYSLFQGYFNLRQYDKALEAIEELNKNYSGSYPAVWCKYQKSLIYRDKRDYDSEKGMLQEILRNGPGNEGRFLKNSYVFLARERLLEIYAVQRDYLNGFAEMAKLYKSGFVISGIILTMLLYGFYIFLLFVYSRIFFYSKTEEAIKGKFRLRYLWLFWIAITLLPLFIQLFLFWFNYSANNLMGRLKLDPLLVSFIIGQVLIAGLCIGSLKKKYQFDNAILGFVSGRARYNIVAPLLVVAGLILFWQGYGYIIDKVFSLPSPQSPLQDFMEHLKFQGDFLQKGLLLVSLVVVGPVSEEILFRLFLFLFLKQFTGSRSALVFSALAFAFAHNAPLLIPYYFIMSLAFSILYLRSKSILPSMISHGLINLLAFSLP